MQIQLQKPKEKDWGSEVRQNIEELNLGVSFEDIQMIAKAALKKCVRTKIKEHAFAYLVSIKKSKTKDVPYDELKAQEYLEANKCEMNIDEKQFLFKCRSRMLNLKFNMKNE